MGAESEKHAQLIPEGATRLPDLTIGGKTPQELEKALNLGGFRVSDWARDMLRSWKFPTIPNPQILSLVRVKVSDLDLTGRPTTDQIYAKANELGLDLCPAEVGPHLRLANDTYEWLYIGMKPIAVSGGAVVFKLRRVGDGLGVGGNWVNSGGFGLDGNWANPDATWSPKDEFVFSLRK